MPPFPTHPTINPANPPDPANAVCPHCLTDNPGRGAFCAACGKALPGAYTSPKIATGKAFASSATGRTVQADELSKKAKSAFGILLGVGILHFVVGTAALVGGIIWMANSGPNAAPLSSSPSSGLPAGFGPAELIGIGIITVPIGLLFVGLGIWARFMPLPAAITGLAIYGTLSAADVLITALTAPQLAFRGIFIKVLIIIALFKAVKAGMQHRELKKQMAAGAFAGAGGAPPVAPWPGAGAQR